MRAVLTFLTVAVMNLGGCVLPHRSEPIHVPQYAASAEPRLATMSGDVNIVLLGLRAAHSAHDPFCAKILILDFVAEGPDPSALYVASCMADEIANDPSRFVHVYYMQNGVRKDLPLIPATDKHMFGTQPLGRNGSVIRIMESCGIMTSQCLDSRPYVVEITTVPPPPARLVDPAIEVAFDSKRIEQSPTIATVRPQSWHLIAP